MYFHIVLLLNFKNGDKNGEILPFSMQYSDKSGTIKTKTGILWQKRGFYSHRIPTTFPPLRWYNSVSLEKCMKMLPFTICENYRIRKVLCKFTYCERKHMWFFNIYKFKIKKSRKSKFEYF